MKRLIAFALVYIIWGSTYLAIRYAILTIPPFIMAGVRFVIAGAILYGLGMIRGEKKPTGRQWRNTVIIGVALLLGGNGAVTWAEQMVPSGITALLVAVVPMWLVLFDWIRPHGNRPSWGVLLGVVIGFAGVVELVGIHTFQGNGNIAPIGVAVLMIGSMLWAGGSLFAKAADLPSPVRTTAMEMLVGGVALLIAGAVTGEFSHWSPHTVSLTSVMGLIYLITFGSLVAYTAYTWLVQNASPAAVGTYAYVNPVVAIILGWLVAHEPVTKETIIGATVIIAAVTIITTAKR